MDLLARIPSLATLSLLVFGLGLAAAFLLGQSRGLWTPQGLNRLANEAGQRLLGWGVLLVLLGAEAGLAVYLALLAAGLQVPDAPPYWLGLLLLGLVGGLGAWLAFAGILVGGELPAGASNPVPQALLPTLGRAALVATVICLSFLEIGGALRLVGFFLAREPTMVDRVLGLLIIVVSNVPLVAVLLWLRMRRVERR